MAIPYPTILDELVNCPRVRALASRLLFERFVVAEHALSASRPATPRLYCTNCPAPPLASLNLRALKEPHITEQR